MNLPEDKMTAEEYQWAQENVAHYKRMNIAELDCVMLLLKDNNIVLGETIEQAVRMEINKEGEVIEMDGFETDEINSLLWDE